MGLKGLNYFLAGLVFTAGCSSSRSYREKAQEKFRELIEKYPESYWVKVLKESKLIEE